jgi:histidinol-phosphate aminotransferase
MTIRPRQALLNPDLMRPHALGSIPRDPQTIWLDKNENLDPELLALTNQVLSQIDPIALATYPEAGHLYRRLAQWLEVDPQCLLLTPGSDGAIRLAFEAFVDPGDSVVHTHPTFAMYPVYCQMFGARAHAIGYSDGPSGPELDVDALFAAVRHERPKLVCLPNPDSPTGTIQDETMLAELLRECERAGSVLLIDEAYHPFYEWTAIPWVAKSPNLVVARTFAKAWGVAGLRIGYLVAQAQTAALLHKLRPMYEVSTLAIEFMSRMLDHAPAMQKAVQRTLEGKAAFAARMEQLGLRVLRTHGNFLHVRFGEHASRVHAALRGHVLYRESFTVPGLTGFSRFSMAPITVLEPVIQRIEQVVWESS